ncbi:single-stranded DNA-binding protein [Streptococcus mitis]|uniref:single-stranded DNA-binding protein n=1 Tax=Streptococcus mitis TaxID=28037 RepID=UPI0025EA37F8|nr:single-stranded DNA-binding protein [uncultured Streptococcus sp.]
MDKEMININANLIEAPVKSTFMRDTEEVSVANFTLVKRYGKGKEYIHCAVYGDKVTEVMKLSKDDFVHVFGYFNQRVKEDKTYRNFIVKSFNKIESKEESEEE